MAESAEAGRRAVPGRRALESRARRAPVAPRMQAVPDTPRACLSAAPWAQVNSDAPTYQAPSGVAFRPQLDTGSQRAAASAGRGSASGSSKARPGLAGWVPKHAWAEKPEAGA